MSKNWGLKNIHTYKMWIRLLIVLLLFMVALPVRAATRTVDDSVQIEAVGSVDYDLDNNVTTATHKVKLTHGDIIIEAEKLVYDGKTGLVTASDTVQLSTSTSVYHTQSLIYNLHQHTGTLDAFTGTIAGGARNYNLTGSGVELKDNSGTMSNPTITRCPLPKPEYLFKAKKISFNGKRVTLHGVTLLIKGIPVLYLPSVSLNVNERDLPNVVAGYNSTDGFNVKYQSSTQINDTFNWRFRGELSTKDESNIGTGIGYTKGAGSNSVDLLYYFKGYWGVEDQLAYDTNQIHAGVDFFNYASDAKKLELGVNLTRKYWATPIGNWQFGIFSWRVSAYDTDDQKYGGTYGGYRLDYQPISDLTLGYQWIRSFTAHSDYRDFLEDYQVGGNVLMNLQVPITKEYKAGFEGTYNNTNDDWVHEIFSVTKETCCLKTKLGWDVAKHAMVFGFQVKF